MPTVPPVPTRLVELTLGTEPRRGVPLAVLVARSASDDSPEPGPGAAELGLDSGWLAEAGMSGAPGAVQPVPPRGTRPGAGWVVGIGDGSPRDWRSAGACLVRAADAAAAANADAGRPVTRTLQVPLPPGTTAEQAAAFALGAAAGSHRYRVSGQQAPARLRTLHLVAPDGGAGGLASAVDRAAVLAAATGLARDLANTPSDVKDPAWLARTGARLARDVPSLTAAVRDERWLAAHRFGGILAVGGGSARPPRLLELAWRPTHAKDAVLPKDPALPKGAVRHLVLVGKGITFDTGGVSIKPAEGMHLMRTDMSGGAAVIAALLAIARLRLPLRVTGLVPCAENHVSGAAYRPATWSATTAAPPPR